MKTLKTIIRRTITVLILTLTLTSCSSDDDASDSEQSTYFLNAKVDGVDFSRENVIVSALADDTSFYTISALGDTSIILTLNSPTSTGIFTVSLTTALSYQQNIPFAVWGAGGESGNSGTITITENTDDFIKGTFSFTGVNLLDNSTKEISQGVFKAKKL